MRGMDENSPIKHQEGLSKRLPIDKRRLTVSAQFLLDWAKRRRSAWYSARGGDAIINIPALGAAIAGGGMQGSD